MSSLRVLVTGGAGFIGSHVADAYVAAGHEVVVLDDLSRGHRANVPAAARFVEADVRSPAAAALLEHERFDVLSHHAAQMDVRRSVADPRFDADVNVLGLLNLLEAGRRGGLRRVVLASTGGAIYGEQEEFPAAESHPTHPLSPYGCSKLAGEAYLGYYAAEYGMETVALRYGNVYGPRQSSHGEAGVVAIFCERLLAGEAATIYGDGEQTRDYVYVADVAAANLGALAAAARGVFNIGTGIETSVNELYRAVAAAAGSNEPPRYAAAKPGEQRRSVISAERARSTLGWPLPRSLAAGIPPTYAAFNIKGRAAALPSPTE